MLSGARRSRQFAIEGALFLLIVPLLTFPSGAFPILAVVLLALWAYDRRGWSSLRVTPWLAPLLLLAMSGLLSTAAASSPAVGIPKLVALLLGIATVIMAVRAHEHGIPLPDALLLFLTAGILLALALLVGTNWADKWPGATRLSERMPRLLRGLPGAVDGFHPNAGAGSLLLFLPAALQTALDSHWPRRLRITGMLTALTLIFTLVLTQSRGAVVGLAGGLALAGLLAGRTRLRVRMAAAAAAVLLLTSLLLALVAPTVVERVAGPHLTTGMASRIELWNRTTRLVWEHRWTGLGFNGFRTQIQAEQPLFLFEPSERPPHAHNVFLQAAADLGVGGLVIYATLLVLVTADLARVARAGQLRHARAAAAGLLAGLLAHLTFGMTDAIPLGAKVGLAFWMLIGLAAFVVREESCAA